MKRINIVKIAKDNLMMFSIMENNLINNIYSLLEIENGVIDFDDRTKFNDNFVCGFISQYKHDDPYFDWIDKVWLKDGEIHVKTTNFADILLEKISDIIILRNIVENYFATKIK